ncbi:MAG: helix-turn-helix domain-containing protein, partial [Elusimicrobia bacterium]|nr:helix-turn-helix domain-containing protein [Elusimicrobiota bacterium]
MMTTNPVKGVLVEELASSLRMLKRYRQALAVLPKGDDEKRRKYQELIVELDEQIAFIRGALDQPKLRRRGEKTGIGLRVGREISRARKAVNVTQAELARRLKTNRQRIMSIETDAGNMTVKTLSRIARALNCRLEIRITGV